MSTDSYEKYQKARTEFNRLCQIGPSQRPEGSLDKARVEMEEAWQEYVQEEDQETLEIIYSCSMNYLYDCYKNESNSLFAWRAYQYARQAAKPVPQWFFDYLDKTATELINLTGRNPKSGELKAALEIYTSGGPAAFRSYKDVLKRNYGKSLMERLLSNPARNRTEIYRTVASQIEKLTGQGTDEDAVRKWLTS